nr:MAG TPA: hypothetical protein [Caudoviricetes sp.]
MENQENFRNCSSKKVREAVSSHPDYKVRWMAGFAWNGAGSRQLKREGERKILRPGGWFMGTFEDELNRCLNWACAQNMKIDHDKKEIFINGFSENDML